MGVSHRAVTEIIVFTPRCCQLFTKTPKKSLTVTHDSIWEMCSKPQTGRRVPGDARHPASRPFSSLPQMSSLSGPLGTD